jgi:hypothetical protein
MTSVRLRRDLTRDSSIITSTGVGESTSKAEIFAPRLFHLHFETIKCFGILIGSVSDSCCSSCEYALEDSSDCI